MLNSFYPTIRIINVSIFITLAALVLLTGCSSFTGRQGSSGNVSIELPTAAPTPEPTPANTRVVPVEALTPPPTPTITPIPDEVRGLVVDIIDGDTIAVVLDGDQARQAYSVRYLGIEAPDSASGDPWGIVAYETNEKLARLKVVRLVRDQTDFDAEGYLLRYVYIDNLLVNVNLVERGLARAAIEAPDTRFETAILAAESRAQQEQRGLWGPNPPTATPAVVNDGTSESSEASVTVTPSITATLVSTSTITATVENEAEPTDEITVTATTEPTTESTSEDN